MNIQGIIWLDEVVEKNQWKHQVSTDEVEEVFANSPMCRFAERGKVEDEDLYIALGRTESGRYLTVFFIHKNTREALPISVRNMTKKERRQYEKK